MSTFVKGLTSWPALMRRSPYLELGPDQLSIAKQGVKKMTDDVVDEIDRVLKEHSDAIASIEAFMEQHAQKAAAAPDPLRLQAIVAQIRTNTHRLHLLLEKFPLIP